jgi:alpha-beta hydrolase superfamily lysophospholipase
MQIDVGGGVGVAARFHPASADLPTILHFHGNGEIVADYDDLAPTYHGSGASLVCADFRGYGRSTGQPSIRGLVRDAQPVLDAVLELLEERGHTGPVVVMGRSLGSAPAIELASSRAESIAGLIIESGFAQTIPLLEFLGVDVPALGADRSAGDDNEDKMARVAVPLLVLHAEHDTILPPWNAERNYERAASVRKRLVMIPGADHNSIIAMGGRFYWGAIAEFLKEVAA